MVADAAAPYFHHFFNFSDSHPPPLPPRGSQLKFTPSPLKRQGRGGSELWLGSLRVVFQKLLKGAQFQAIIVVLSSISTK